MKLYTKNIFSLFGFDAIIRLLGFISTAYVARTLGSEPFGVLNLGMAVLSYGIILLSPGLHIIGTRTIAQQSTSDKSIVTQITSLRLALSLLFCAAIVAFVYLLISDKVARYTIALYVLSMIPYAFQLGWYFQGKQRVGVIGLSQSLSLLSFVVLLLFLVKRPADIFYVPIAYFANIGLNALFLQWVYFREQSSGRPFFVFRELTQAWKSLLSQALPVGAASIFGQAILNLPVILLGLFATSIDIANFSAASKLVFFLLAIDRAIYVLFYPLVARTFASNPAELSRQVSRILGYLLLATLPICAGGMVLARSIVELVFGSQYENSVYLFQILLFYFLFTILNSIFAYVVIAVGRERRYSTIIVAVSSVLIGTLIPLTYYWGAVGAAYGMIVGEFLMMAWMYSECRKSISLKVISSSTKPLISAAGMATVLFLLPDVGIAVSLGVGVISYTLGVIVLKGFTKDDIRFLKERFI